MSKIQPNSPCPCGSGKKFKKCCSGKLPAAVTGSGAAATQQKISQILNCINSFEFQQAQFLCRELLRDQPDNLTALQLMGRLTQIGGVYQDSIGLYLHVISRVSNTNSLHFLHYELGLSYLHSEQFKEAATHFQKAEECSPSASEYSIFKGIALWMNGDRNGAEEAFQRAREINPDDPDDPVRFLSAFLHETGRPEEAVELYYPVAEAALTSDVPRKPFYEYEKVTRANTVSGQSERYNFTPELKEMMVASIKGHLRLAPDDTLLDIGGAGGLFAIELAPFVKAIMLTDINKDLVDHARGNTKHLGNVETCLDDAVTMSNIHGTYSKILMYGVTQYMTDFPSFERVLENMFDRLPVGGTVLIGYNIRLGDVKKSVEMFFDAFKEMKKGFKIIDIQHLRNLLFLMENAFRIDIPRTVEACKRIGFQQVRMEPNLFVTSSANSGDLFDLILEK